MPNQNIADNLKKFVTKVGIDTIDKVGEDIQIVAKQNAPVKTGLLRSSIILLKDKAIKQNKVIANTKYAWFVEMGTKFITPRAYLRNALGLVMSKFH